MGRHDSGTELTLIFVKFIFLSTLFDLSFRMQTLSVYFQLMTLR